MPNECCNFPWPYQTRLLCLNISVIYRFTDGKAAFFQIKQDTFSHEPVWCILFLFFFGFFFALLGFSSVQTVDSKCHLFEPFSNFPLAHLVIQTFQHHFFSVLHTNYPIIMENFHRIKRHEFVYAIVALLMW